MKHLKKYNVLEATRYRRRADPGPDLLNVEDIDADLVQIFLSLTDLGYNLEVLHQNGSSTYHLFSSNNYFYLLDQLKQENNLLKDYIYEWIEKEYENYTNHMMLIVKELPEIRARVKEIVGLNRFDINSAGMISMTFDHLNQGYDNVGKKMLVGDPSKSIYH
jgi:hypothetical protein